jgi:hypothetical protein
VFAVGGAWQAGSTGSDQCCGMPTLYRLGGLQVRGLRSRGGCHRAHEHAMAVHSHVLCSARGCAFLVVKMGCVCSAWIACACCREHLGLHPCDKRRPMREIMPSFPAVDFSQVSSPAACCPPDPSAGWLTWLTRWLRCGSLLHCCGNLCKQLLCLTFTSTPIPSAAFPCTLAGSADRE